MSAATVALRLASAGERLDFDAPRRRSPARAAAAVRPRSSRQSITRGRRRRDVMSVYAVAARAPPRVVPVAFEQVGHDVTADGAVLRAGAEILPL
jgi:hypothetical protein